MCIYQSNRGKWGRKYELGLSWMLCHCHCAIKLECWQRKIEERVHFALDLKNRFPFLTKIRIPDPLYTALRGT